MFTWASQSKGKSWLQKQKPYEEYLCMFDQVMIDWIDNLRHVAVKQLWKMTQDFYRAPWRVSQIIKFYSIIVKYSKKLPYFLCFFNRWSKNPIWDGWDRWCKFLTYTDWIGQSKIYDLTLLKDVTHVPGPRTLILGFL